MGLCQTPQQIKGIVCEKSQGIVATWTPVARGAWGDEKTKYTPED